MMGFVVRNYHLSIFESRCVKESSRLHVRHYNHAQLERLESIQGFLGVQVYWGAFKVNLI